MFEMMPERRELTELERKYRDIFESLVAWEELRRGISLPYDLKIRAFKEVITKFREERARTIPERYRDIFIKIVNEVLPKYFEEARKYYPETITKPEEAKIEEEARIEEVLSEVEVNLAAECIHCIRPEDIQLLLRYNRFDNIKSYLYKIFTVKPDRLMMTKEEVERTLSVLRSAEFKELARRLGLEKEYTRYVKLLESYKKLLDRGLTQWDLVSYVREIAHYVPASTYDLFMLDTLTELIDKYGDTIIEHMPFIPESDLMALMNRLRSFAEMIRGKTIPQIEKVISFAQKLSYALAEKREFEY